MTEHIVEINGARIPTEIDEEITLDDLKEIIATLEELEDKLSELPAEPIILEIPPKETPKKKAPYPETTKDKKAFLKIYDKAKTSDQKRKLAEKQGIKLSSLYLKANRIKKELK